MIQHIIRKQGMYCRIRRERSHRFEYVRFILEHVLQAVQDEIVFPFVTHLQVERDHPVRLVLTIAVDDETIIQDTVRIEELRQTISQRSTPFRSGQCLQEHPHRIYLELMIISW